MTLWTDDPHKQAVIENYFSSFSPLCKKIIEVKSSVKKSYNEKEWEEMSIEEKDHIINEKFITSEMKRRYKNGLSKIKQPSVFPCYNFTTGKKVTDEDEASFVDEHSGRFSWKTKSQMNLKIPDTKVKQVSKVVEDKLLKNWNDINQKSLHPFSPNSYKQSKTHLNSSRKLKLSNIDNLSSGQSNYKQEDEFVRNITITDEDLSVNHVTLQDISNSKLSLHSSSSSDSDDFLLNKKSVIEEKSDIPMKSGYDFLDNW